MTHALTSTRVKRHLRREEGGSQREWNSRRTLNSRRSPGQAKAHQSVLVDEALTLLAPKKGEVALDATAGQGGHSEGLLRAGVTLIALDADETAVEATRERLKKFDSRVQVVHANFKDLKAVLKKHGLETLDVALFDLGWRSEQLAQGKGFSFMVDEPLVMSYGEKPASGFTAADILNHWSEKAIADVLYGYGEERYSRRIAKAVVARRKVAPLQSTIEFVELIADAVPPGYRHGKLHPATRSFQALRIAVNDELGCLEQGLDAAWKHLNPGGRIAVITFHSIEDRLVKRTFATLAKKDGKLLVKKPLIATKTEITHNPSARSAKLRAIQKV